MAETAHTPGPWGYEDPMGPEILSIIANPGAPVYDWIHIAQIGTEPSGDDEKRTPYAEHEANARLIAAAPELLEALDAMEAFVAVMIGQGHEATIPATVSSPLGVPIKVGMLMKQTRAAIAKATGASS